MRNHSSFIIRIILAATIFGGVLLQAGCAFKDIDKRLFVSAIAVDPAENIENGFKVTLKVALPFGAIKESTKPSYAYLSKEGESVGEVIRILETHVDKVLEFGHMKTILINESLLTNHMKTFMDYFVRRGDIQLIAYVAGASPSAEEIIKVEPETEAPASVALFNFFGNIGTESPFITTTYLFQFRRDFFSKGISSVLPIIKTNKSKDELRVNTAIVVDNEKEHLKLNDIETKYYNSLVNGASGFTYEVEDEEKRMLLDIYRIKTDFKINTKNDTPQSIDMNIRMAGIIGESNHKLSLDKLDVYNKMASREIKKKVEKLLKKIQENELDPLGFGLRYRATRLERAGQFEKWESAYPNIQINVKVDVKLQSTGSIE